MTVLTYIDSHAHLDSEQFADDVDQVIADAARVGVTSIINIGCDPERWQTTPALACQDSRIEMVLYPEVFDSYGQDLLPDSLIEVTAKVDRRNEQLQLIGEKISFDVAVIEAEVPFRTIVLVIPQTSDYWRDIEILQRVDGILAERDGGDRIEFELMVSGKPVRIRNNKHRVEWDEELASELAGAIGLPNIRVSDFVTVEQLAGVSV